MLVWKNITLSVFNDSTTLTALAEVQQTSVSAFTSAEVLTYDTTGTPGYCFFNNLTSFPVNEACK